MNVWAAVGIAVLAIVVSTVDLRAAPPDDGPPPRTPLRRAAEGLQRRDGPEPDGRRQRREPEGRRSRAGVRSAEELAKNEAPLEVAWTRGGCAIDGQERFVQRLLGLENKSDLMSLEVWGDSHEYEPFDRVLYYLRVPRAAYVTLFWIGPRHDVFVSFENLRVPADRDVTVNPDAIVVPPLGREQWVAIATLEPFEFPCLATEGEHLAWVERATRVPHGVGRWEVTSKAKRSK